MFVFFSFFLIIFALFFSPMDLRAQEASIYIDTMEPSQVVRTQPPFVSEILLKVQDLPKSSAAHPAVILQNEKFISIVPSPDQTFLAFCVDAKDHDWTGVMEVASKKVRQVGLSFEAEANHPTFSEDGRYLALEESRSPSRSALQVYDLDTGNECSLDGRKVRDKFLNFSEPWFSSQGDRLYFKVEYNNSYRKSLGLRPKQLPPRIGEAGSNCEKVRYYSVAEFMEKFPDQSHHSEMALTKEK